ncbi:MAG: cyclic nucleotide-binding domain-containing protein [Fimbriimonadaceae bacterium]
MRLPEAFRYNYLFKGLSDKQVDKLVDLTYEEDYHEGEVLLHEDGKDHKLMLVLKGKVLVKTASGRTLAMLESGAVLGEVSLLDADPRSASVIAKTKVEVAMIPLNELNKMMEKDAAARAAIMQNLAVVLARRLRDANIRLDGALAVAQINAS